MDAGPDWPASVSFPPANPNDNNKKPDHWSRPMRISKGRFQLYVVVATMAAVAALQFSLVYLVFGR